MNLAEPAQATTTPGRPSDFLRRRGLPAAFALSIAPLAAQAHVEAQVPTSFWGDWPIDAWVTLPLLLAALCYAVGAHRLSGKDSAPTRGARLAYYGGLATVFASLQSPLDAVSEHLFAVH